jgi:hypothetical protein
MEKGRLIKLYCFYFVEGSLMPDRCLIASLHLKRKGMNYIKVFRCQLKNNGWVG